jgi:serine-type D-Ala-D-Ala carboxypeptidase (penicillin-binding protein 5/6)
MSRLPSCLAALAGGLVASLVVAAGPAAAASAGPPAGSSATTNSTIGGPLLASQSVVVEPWPGAPPLPSDLPASAWLVADLTTGQVLAAKDPHGRFLPASTLKTLTAVTLIPRLNPLGTVVPTYDDVNVDGTKVGLVAGARYRIGLVFTAMLIASGNDAADTLATAGGGYDHTLALMNATARELQADDTYAVTPSGLNGPDESVSAYDLALIFRAGLAMPAFRHYIGTVSAELPDPLPGGKPYQIYTHDRLLGSYPGMIGGKNGYTVAADGTFVGAATQGGTTILVSLLHAYPDFWPMATALLNWGFAAVGHVTPIGQLVSPLPPPTDPAVKALAAQAPLHVAAVRAHNGSGLTLPLGIFAGSAVLAAGVARRGWRRGPRLRLPPL